MNRDPLESTLPEYRLDEVVSQSEMATLYRATERETGRTFAIKVSQPSAEAALHLERECEVLRRVTDDSVARLVRSGFLPDGRQYLVREYVNGDNLERVLEGGGRLKDDLALMVAWSVAKALASAHQHGLIHRDIKPSNVIVPRGADGALVFPRATLTDFGAAGHLIERKNDRGLTAAGQIFGTPMYMSPEQLAGLPQTAAADVYGLGLLLYRMLFGRLPYPDAANFFQLANHILNERVSIPDDSEARAPVGQLVLDCLAKDPNLRPRDGSALLERVSLLMSNDTKQWVARVVSSSPRPHVQATQELSNDSRADGEQRPRPIAVASETRGEKQIGAQSRAGRLWLVALIGLCLVVSGLWLAMANVEVAAPPSQGQPRWWWSLWAVLVAVPISAGAGYSTHRWLETRRTSAHPDLSRLLTRSRGAAALRESLAIDLEKVLVACREVDQAMIAKTVGILLHEYDRAKESSDRQAALVAAVGLIEKLTQKLSPWYVRYRGGVAWGISIAGSLLGVAKTAFDLWGTTHR